MNLFIIFIVFINSVISATFRSAVYQTLFDNWKSNYNKNYATPEEENDRFEKWRQNLNAVVKHNLEYEQNKQTFRLEMNHLADLTADEVVSNMTGYKTPEWKQPPGTKYLKLYNVNDTDLPDFIDWRKKGLVTYVKNQRNCGACYAFAAAGALEGQYARKTGILRSLSVQNILDCSAEERDHGCFGGQADKAFRYIIKQGGIDTWASYPYEAAIGECRFNEKDVGAKMVSYVDLPKGNEQLLKEAVATVGPISVGIDSKHSSFHLYAYGIYQNPFCNSSHLTHAVVAVGYGVSKSGTDYWIVKNSWGPNWGENGYVRMIRNLDNNCGIATKSSYPLL